VRLLLISSELDTLLFSFITKKNTKLAALELIPLKTGRILKSHKSKKKFKTLFMRKIALMFIAVAALFLTSCKMTMPLTATSNPVGNKVGTAKATIIIGLFFNQDASIKKAAKAGGISKISTVDVKYTNILGIIQSYETIVTGE
jgi:hypothetical protein